jgi:hypothetical protein
MLWSTKDEKMIFKSGGIIDMEAYIDASYAIGCMQMVPAGHI